MKKGTATRKKPGTAGFWNPIGRRLSVEHLIIGGSILASLLFIGVIFLSSRASRPNITPDLPTPIGFPDTAQDVGTMVGQSAPAFTLTDDTGQSVTVSPGQTGRPTVLITHMGVT